MLFVNNVNCSDSNPGNSFDKPLCSLNKALSQALLSGAKRLVSAKRGRFWRPRIIVAPAIQRTGNTEEADC